MAPGFSLGMVDLTGLDSDSDDTPGPSTVLTVSNSTRKRARSSSSESPKGGNVLEGRWMADEAPSKVQRRELTFLRSWIGYSWPETRE